MCMKELVMNIVKASAFVPKKREKSLLNHSPMMAGHSVQKMEKSEKKKRLEIMIF